MFLLFPSVRIVVSGAKTIAAKRNMGVRESGADVLAFIDSDAYPEEGWIQNAVRILAEDPSLGAVGGPNLPPPDQSRTETYVGQALKSPLVSGKWTYRKVIQPARIVYDLPSCNLVVRKAVYERLGGMDEALFTGEDMEFCARLVQSNFKILYTPEVIVYHKNRALGSFFLQRVTYGASVPDLIRRGFRFDFLLLLLPAVFLLFLMSAPLGIIWTPWGWMYLGVCVVYLTGVLIEAIRHGKTVFDIPGTMVALIIGNVSPGLGTIAKLSGVLPDLRTIFRNN